MIPAIALLTIFLTACSLCKSEVRTEIKYITPEIPSIPESPTYEPVTFREYSIDGVTYQMLDTENARALLFNVELMKGQIEQLKQIIFQIEQTVSTGEGGEDGTR